MRTGYMFLTLWLAIIFYKPILRGVKKVGYGSLFFVFVKNEVEYIASA